MTAYEMADYTYIDTPEALRELCDGLRSSPYLALDTEFIREKTYYPHLCLLQVADDERVACIDPLALEEHLDPLLDLIYDPGVVKVLHAARQDLEILYQLRGRLPEPVYDTQLAATVLGHGDQIGYGALVQAELGVQLDKAHARADWCHRPLSAEQLRYAADDVVYLRRIYHQQVAEMKRLGRSRWLAEDFAALSEPANYDNPPLEAWRRVKGGNRLKGVQLAVLQQLGAWREERAQRSDRPRRWMLKDELMLDIARHMPASAEKLQRIRGMEEGFVRRHGAEILALVEQARGLPKSAWPQLEEGLRPTPEQEPVVDGLMAVLRESCREHRVSPAAVASRRDLELIVAGVTDVAALHGWRAEVAGKRLAAFAAGDVVLGVRDGGLDVRERT